MKSSHPTSISTIACLEVADASAAELHVNSFFSITIKIFYNTYKIFLQNCKSIFVFGMGLSIYYVIGDKGGEVLPIYYNIT